MTRKRWLVKTEPDVYSIDDLERDGETAWDRVRSFPARLHLKAMRKGDLAFVYHSNASPSAIVGVAEVVGEAEPDPSQFDRAGGEEMGFDPKSDPADPKWVMVRLRFVERLPRPIPLDEVKATPALAKMALLRLSRLSVQPVTAAEWKVVTKLAARPAQAPGKRGAPRGTGRARS